MRLIDADALKAYIDAQNGRPFIGCTIGEALKIMTDEQPTVDAVPVEWIEKKIEWLVGLDNAFSGLAASSLRAMLASWRKENGDDQG